MMRKLRAWAGPFGLPGILALLTCLAPGWKATAETQQNVRIAELLEDEARFHATLKDHLGAISRLQLAQDQGLLSPDAGGSQLLLARSKLAYGLQLEAAFELHAVLGESVPPPVRNALWYELASALYHRGYLEAAEEILANVAVDSPTPLAGEIQLLKANILMALNRNPEAAQELAVWRGDPRSAGYGHYNRGIALIRAGEHSRAASALEKAVESPAPTDELKALQDKARLSLGYVHASLGDYGMARRQLRAIGARSPFSNRALLALGWLDYKQDRKESALASWLQLRERSSDDPAVLETLLVIPALHRELEALPAASAEYRAAIAAYSNQLKAVLDARQAVLTNEALTPLLERTTAADSGQTDAESEAASVLRYLGPLLASRQFGETAHNYDELLALQRSLGRSLRQIETLEGQMTESGNGLSRIKPSPPAVSATAKVLDREAQQSARPPRVREPGKSPPETVPDVRSTPRRGEGGEPYGAIPQLPQVSSPARREVKPLPGAAARGLPQSGRASLPPASEYIREPPDPEIRGMPHSEVLWLPRSGEFFRRPGQEAIDDYAYPDSLPKRVARREQRYDRHLQQLLPLPGEEHPFDPGEVPVSSGLRELAVMLESADARISAIDQSLSGDGDDMALQARIDALRIRVADLQARINRAIALHEKYARALALEALEERRVLLEDLLQEATLELAKVYDQSTAP